MLIGSPLAEILIVLAAYFVGGIPFGWLIAKVFKKTDLRTVGSGGTGATNCSRLWKGPASVGMFIVVFVITVLLFWSAKFWVHYEYEER